MIRPRKVREGSKVNSTDDLGHLLGVGSVFLFLLLIAFAASTFIVHPREAHVLIY